MQYRSLIDTLASEVICLRVIKRRDLSNERNAFKSKTIFNHKKTRLKPERATRPIPKRRRPLYADSYKADPEKKKASVRDSYKVDPEKKKADSYKADPEKKKASVRDSYKADPEKKKASLRDSYKADPEKKKASVRDSYKAIPKRRTPLYATATTQIESNQSAKRQRYQEDLEENRVLLKGSDIKRTSRRTVLLKGRNTRTIQLPLRHLKGIVIGMTPLSDWLNALPRGSGIAGVTELCDGMLYCTSIKKL